MLMVLDSDGTIYSWYYTEMAQSAHGTKQTWHNLLTVLHRDGATCSRYYTDMAQSPHCIHTEMAQSAHGTTQRLCPRGRAEY